MERKVFKSAEFGFIEPRVRIGLGWWSFLPNLELRLLWHSQEQPSATLRMHLYEVSSRGYFLSMLIIASSERLLSGGFSGGLQ